MKRFQFFTSILLTAFFLFACSKNDDGPNKPDPIPDPTPDNRAPEAFNLLQVADNDTAVALMPTLTWQAATDPDGDAVTYDIYLGTETDPASAQPRATDLSQTSYTTTDRLHLDTPYFWKVVAKDDNNNQTESAATFTFTTRNLSKGEEATASAGFPARFRHTSVVFDGKIWVLGGYGGTTKNDIWSSSDGTNWELAQRTMSHFSARDGHSSVVYDGKIWVMGGHDGTRKEDVWHSTDGTNWTETDPDDNFTARTAHTSVVFENKIWVIGGHDGTNYKNDVWNSTDGMTNWEEITPDAGFTARRFHTSVVFENKIWVIGGNDGTNRKNDVWNSTDGINWEEATPNAGFSAREDHSSVVYDNKIWVIGGYEGNYSSKNDVWYSSDGVIWEEALGSAEADFPERRGPSSVVYDGKIWVMGGHYYDFTNDVFLNDVWYMD